jgi:hypothetical protein
MTRTLLTSTLIIQLSVAMAAQTPQATGTAVQQRAASFVTALSQAMARQDRAAVADMVRIPLSATAGGIGIPVGSRAELLKIYDGLFTAELRCLVDEAAAKGAAALRVDSGGVTIGSGNIHASDVGGAFKITSINVPAATGVAAPPNPAPRRVTIRRGDVQYSGRLYGDGVDTYVISARKGDVVQARIEKFPGRSAAVRVVEQKTGKAIEQPGSPAPRLWTGTIQQPGDYRIEVVRLAPYCMPSFTYLLTITLK